MSNEHYFTGDEGAVFVQLAGPGTEPQYLGCHDMGDVDAPQGDETRTYCPDPIHPGRHVIATRQFSAAGPVTTDLTFPQSKTADLLEEMLKMPQCVYPLYVKHSECGRRNLFSAYERGTVYADARITGHSRSGQASRQADGSAAPESTQSYTFSIAFLQDYFPLLPTRRTIAETEALLDIYSCTETECGSNCGPLVEACKTLYAVATAGAAAIANGYTSADYGVTWTVWAALPFIADEDISAVICVQIAPATTRIIVTRGTTAAGANAEIGYSDDGGASWTNVDVGSTATEFVPWNAGIFTIDGSRIWVCTDTGAGAAGNVYYSDDWGLTWSAGLTGATDALNALAFCSNSTGIVVGDTNEIQYTADGGEHWTAITGPAAQAAADALSAVCFNSEHWLVGYDDGEVWRTRDGGTTWAEVTTFVPNGALSGYTVSAVNGMDWIDDYCVFAAVQLNDGANDWSAIARTVDGGYTWEFDAAPVDCDGADGMHAVHACSYNQAFGVGCVATTSMVLEVAP